METSQVEFLSSSSFRHICDGWLCVPIASHICCWYWCYGILSCVPYLDVPLKFACVFSFPFHIWLITFIRYSATSIPSPNPKHDFIMHVHYETICNMIIISFCKFYDVVNLQCNTSNKEYSFWLGLERKAQARPKACLTLCCKLLQSMWDFFPCLHNND